MSLSTATKAQIVKTHKRSKNDTGSPEVQIALLTASINALTGHLKAHPKDVHTRHGLMMKVSQRRSMMGYLKRTSTERYASIIKELDVRG